MKIARRREAGFATEVRLEFSAAEKKTLRAAAAIAAEARTLGREFGHCEWEDGEDDDLLAEIEHAVRELLAENIVLAVD